MEAIVLVGGRGTRMGALTSTVPKPMLALCGRPLIAHQLHRLARAGITHAVLATGYLASAFEALREQPLALDLTIVREDRPLGTGGAMAYAAAHLRGEAHQPVVVTNGDLLSGHDLRCQVAAFGRQPQCDVILHVRSVPDPRAFGVVEVEAGGLVTAFVEKPARPRSRLVSAGSYVLRPDALGVTAGDPASFERDILPRLVAARRVWAHEENAYFRDVGTPESLARAEDDLRAGLVPDCLPAS